MKLNTIKALQQSMHTALKAAKNHEVSYRELMLAYEPKQLGYPFIYDNYQNIYLASLKQTMNYKQSIPKAFQIDLAEYNFNLLVDAIDGVLQLDDYGQLTHDLTTACEPFKRTK